MQNFQDQFYCKTGPQPGGHRGILPQKIFKKCRPICFAVADYVVIKSLSFLIGHDAASDKTPGGKSGNVCRLESAWDEPLIIVAYHQSSL